eukprot:759630_1
MAKREAESIEEQIKRLKSQLESLQTLGKEKAEEGSEHESRQSKQSAAASSGDAEVKDNSGAEVKERESDQILIVVANRLPVSMQHVDGEWKFKPSAGGLVTALKQLGNLDMEWVGCPGYIEPSERDYISNALNEYNVHPVFVEKRDYDNYYNGFCNGILWPLFHYIELNDEIIVPYFDKFYVSYSRINLLFAKAIDDLIKSLQRTHAEKQILIWIHDYHLMLCPNYIRRMQRDAMIGFFLHIPFPNWEQFRILPKSIDLLQGVLACNLIGFHIHDYSQHFRGACAHILQCELAPDSIIYHGRMSIISTHPIGTDISKWRDGLKQKSIQNLIKQYENVHHGKQIILGVDRLDFIKGIPHKLYAFSKFLEDNPDLRDRVVYIQIAVPSRQSAPEYIKLTKKCNELVGKINSKYASFSSVPIHFLYQSFGFNDLVALYNISSVCYVTSLRDGMNLVSYEYISCQSMANPGVLIVSEFAGSAQSLGCGSIVVNPWNVSNVASALQTALRMDLQQRQTHQQILYKIISKNTVQHWANQFINSLQISYQKCPHNAPIVPSPCNTYSIQRAFNSASSGNRVIILGLGGTLIPSITNSGVNLTEYSSMQKISGKIKQAINRLSTTSSNHIAILSMLPRKSVEVLLRDVHCIQYAENGYFMRDFNVASRHKEWQITTNYTDNSWKDEVLKIMKYFKERTPNVMLDDLTSFVSFRYNVHGGTAGDDVITFNSNSNTRNNISQCVTSLQTGPLQSSYARLVHDTSTGHIQVRQPGVSKLSSITRLIQNLSSIDYVLCIANFLSFDEELFVYLNGLKKDISIAEEEETTKTKPMARVMSAKSLAKMYPATDVDQVRYHSSHASHQHFLADDCVVDTIKVGRYATRAKHYVANNRKVEDILVRLCAAEDKSSTPSGLLGSKRNWSVSENLHMLAADEDAASNVPNIGDYDAMEVKGGDKLFNPISIHDNNNPPIPPTAPVSFAAAADQNSSDYGSFDEEDVQKVKIVDVD